MSERRTVLLRLAPLALLLALAVASLPDEVPGLRLATGDPARAAAASAVFDRLGDDATVLVGFDPDIGTYAEIRATTRAVIADLLSRDATLVFVSLTPEGRALAVAELERLGRVEANPRQIEDLGFIPGAEAALVALTRSLGPDAISGPLTGIGGGSEVADASLAVVIGGNDLGPRAWVEQVAPRTADLPLVAVAPTVLLPELLPYLGSGQLAALLATPPDGAAYRDLIDPGRLDRVLESGAPPELGILVGLLVAVALLGQGLVAHAARTLRTARNREPR